MDRIFLAVIASGLLLAAASVSLLVATSGGNTVAELKVPPQSVPAGKGAPRRIDGPINGTVGRDDTAR
jgi:hypothetical protein